MADQSLRHELDAIAMELEEKGHSKLASIVDICNHEIHSRKASVKPSKPAAKTPAVASAKPKRQAKPARARVSAAKAAGAAAALKDVRWARRELRDIASEFRKLGSVADARKLLRMAEELAEDERELMEVAGPVVNVDTAVEGEDLDLDTPVDADDCVCEDVEYDEEAPETYEDDVDDESAEEEAEESAEEETEEEGEEPELKTVEACAKEIRAIARELRREGDHRNAAIMTRLACECESMTGPEFDPSVEVVPLPPTDGGEPPIDATNFALGDDENLLDFAVEVVSDDENEEEDEHVNEFAPETEETEEVAVEEAVDPEESKSAEEYLTASVSLRRTAKALRAEGLSADAAKLMRKAHAYETIAKLRTKR